MKAMHSKGSWMADINCPTALPERTRRTLPQHLTASARAALAKAKGRKPKPRTRS